MLLTCPWELGGLGGPWDPLSYILGSGGLARRRSLFLSRLLHRICRRPHMCPLRHPVAPHRTAKLSSKAANAVHCKFCALTRWKGLHPRESKILFVWICVNTAVLLYVHLKESIWTSPFPPRIINSSFTHTRSLVTYLILSRSLDVFLSSLSLSLSLKPQTRRQTRRFTTK
jgi:hypothetical protein